MKVTKKIVLDYLLMTAGLFMLGAAIIIFWKPHNLVTGGVSGLAIMIYYYTGVAGFQTPIPVWLSNLVINLPLFIISYKAMPRDFFIRSAYGYFILTLSLYVLEFLPAIPSDILLASVFGGVVAGIGIGILFRMGATTGGTTLVAGMIHRRLLPHISTAKILFALDACIIFIGFIAFGPVAAMYAIIAIFVSTKVTDATVEGLAFSKAAFIISQQADAIADKIMIDVKRGVTEISCRGRFTKQDQTMLLCVVPAKEIVTLKQLVYALDKNAFVIVTDVREVLGEGFKPPGQA